MFPYRDENQTLRTPVITFLIIGINVLVWLVAWPLMLALWATRFLWSGLEPALKVMQEDAWRRTLEANKEYEEWSAEQLEARYRTKREDEAKIKAVLEREAARTLEALGAVQAQER